jgi:hypothetical protein
METKVRPGIEAWLSEELKTSETITDPLSILTCGFLDQLCAEMRNVHPKGDEWVVPADLFKILQERGLDFFVRDLRDFHSELLARIKHEKINALKDAQYGATAAHVEFIRHLFASEHKEFVPTEDVEGSEDESG